MDWQPNGFSNLKVALIKKPLSLASQKKWHVLYQMAVSKHTDKVESDSKVRSKNSKVGTTGERRLSSSRKVTYMQRDGKREAG